MKCIWEVTIVQERTEFGAAAEKQFFHVRSYEKINLNFTIRTLLYNKNIRKKNMCYKLNGNSPGRKRKNIHFCTHN